MNKNYSEAGKMQATAARTFTEIMNSTEATLEQKLEAANGFVRLLQQIGRLWTNDEIQGR